MKESQKIVAIHQLDDKALDNDPGGNERSFPSSLPNDYHEPLMRPEYTSIGDSFYIENIRASSGLSLLAETRISNTFPSSMKHGAPRQNRRISFARLEKHDLKVKNGTTHHPIVDFIIPQRDMILVRRVPIVPTPTISSQYRTRYRTVGFDPEMNQSQVEAVKRVIESYVPLFQLDLARDRTRLRRNELLQIAHRVRGETFHADCVFDAKKREMNREMEMTYSQLFIACVDVKGK
jgi:hypothetical protein